MTTYDIWMAIRGHEKNAYNAVNVAGVGTYKLDIQFLSQAGTPTYQVIGAPSAAAESALKNYASLIRKVIVDEVPAFTNPFVRITVLTELDITVPVGQQAPPPPPIFVPRLPRTTPPTSNDREYVV